MLREFAVKSGKRALVLALRGFEGFLDGLDRAEVT